MDRPLTPQEREELKALKVESGEAEMGEAPLTPEERAELSLLKQPQGVQVSNSPMGPDLRPKEQQDYPGMGGLEGIPKDIDPKEWAKDAAMASLVLGGGVLAAPTMAPVVGEAMSTLGGRTAIAGVAGMESKDPLASFLKSGATNVLMEAPFLAASKLSKIPAVDTAIEAGKIKAARTAGKLYEYARDKAGPVVENLGRNYDEAKNALQGFVSGKKVSVAHPEMLEGNLPEGYLNVLKNRRANASEPIPGVDLGAVLQAKKIGHSKSGWSKGVLMDEASQAKKEAEAAKAMYAKGLIDDAGGEALQSAEKHAVRSHKIAKGLFEKNPVGFLKASPHTTKGALVEKWAQEAGVDLPMVRDAFAMDKAAASEGFIDNFKPWSSKTAMNVLPHLEGLKKLENADKVGKLLSALKSTKDTIED
jgi:hypothetical protein